MVPARPTLLELIAGVLHPDAGTITFAAERIDGSRPHVIARRGIGRTFQNVRPFPELTLEENVVIGALGNASGLGDALERAHQPIWRLDLFEKLHQPASTLPVADRRRLELARVLAMRRNCCCSTRFWPGCGRPRSTKCWRACASSIA